MNVGKRIIILGSPGSGKSTLATQLGNITGLPIVHLDRLFWNPGWVQTPKEEMDQKVIQAANEEQWIMDGNYSRTLEYRLSHANSVIFLDVNRFFCIYRVFKRWVKHHGKIRYDLGEGCPDKIDLEFLLWIWNYPKRSRNQILTLISEHQKSNLITRYHFTSAKQVKKFLKEARIAYDQIPT